MIVIFIEHKVFWELAKDWQHLLSAKLGYEVPMVNAISGRDGHLHIMFGLNQYQGPMPKHYVAVQLEQAICADSGWLTPRYQGHLKGALAVWDYSLVNYCKLKQLNAAYRYVPIWSCEPEVGSMVQ